MSAAAWATVAALAGVILSGLLALASTWVAAITQERRERAGRLWTRYDDDRQDRRHIYTQFLIATQMTWARVSARRNSHSKEPMRPCTTCPSG